MLVSEQKADLNARANNNSTPLNEAAWYGQTNVVQCLIDEFSCSTDTKGIEGRTILHDACNAGHIELAEILLTRYNLDPFSVDDNGNTPLHHVALGICVNYIILLRWR